MDYWGGPKGMLAPPPKLLGGPGPPWTPLFLRLCIYVLSHMNDVEILYKALEFTFSMAYKITAKYQPIVFPENIYGIF